MEDNFTLCQGVSAGGAEKLRSCCHIQGDNIRGVLSCDIMAKVACGVIEKLAEPIFFFLELPDSERDGYKTYYLDNCTKEVALAIMKHYRIGAIHVGFNTKMDYIHRQKINQFQMQ
jgi:hypothetical protein